MSLVTIRRRNAMSLGRIRLRRAANLAAHTQDQARDRALVRTTAVVVHTRTVAVEDTHRTVAVGLHRMAAVEVHRPTVAEAEATANHTRVRALAPTIAREAAMHCS